MPKMSKSALKAMLAAEQASALAAMQSSKLSKERSDASMYFNGDMSADMPAEDGRSSAVSTDVMETIEGLMPQLMEIFAGSEEVCAFNPVSAEDVQAAEQETDYINHVFMNQNNGFLVLYSFIKDALLHKNGFVKYWWEEREIEENETYYDLTDDQFAIISADEDVEITEHTEKSVEDPQLAIQAQTKAFHDVKVTKSKTFAQAKVLGVPPEEVGIEKVARSISISRPEDCNYFFHRVLKSEAELLAQGFDEKQLKTLPTYQAITNTEEINRDTVFEHQNVGEDYNKAARRVEIVEHYIRMDYEGNGKPCLYRVITGGGQGSSGGSGEILKRDGKDEIVEFDAIPFASVTPVPVTHRFFGRSIADLVMDIQRIKTALYRGHLDNIYLANNPRVEVAESMASDSTLDDLLVSRPGGIVRVKTPGGINWQQVPTIGDHIYPALEYFDNVRAQRTGVSKQAQAIDANALQNQSATAANLAYTIEQAKLRLIARIIAETGLKDLFLGLHGLIRKHGQQAQTVRLKNQWVNVDPRDWKKRDDMTIHVGLGTGGKAEQMSLINLIIGMQEKALVGGLTNLVNPGNLYNSAKALTRIAGHKDVDAFFTDPKGQPAPQPPPDPKIIEIQMKAQLEDKKAQVDQAHQQWKMQADAALEQQKFEHEKQLAILKAEMDAHVAKHSMALNERKAELDASIALQKANLDKQTAEHHAQLATQEVATKSQLSAQDLQHKHSLESKAAEEKTAPIVSKINEQGQMLKEVIHHLKAPKRVVRDKAGRVSHIEAVS